LTVFYAIDNADAFRRRNARIGFHGWI
jgi:hypothetical protein